MIPRRARHKTFAWIAFAAGLFVLAMLSGCATLDSGGLSGSVSPDGNGGNNTVVAQSQPGIGGTGSPKAPPPGIGGTGDVAGVAPGIGGTGIIGTVTGFGSIIVNGYHVDYAPGMAVGFKDVSIRAEDLEIGQVVEIEAAGRGSRLQARRIAVRHEVAGPIERIDAARRIAVVFGQRVEITPGVLYTADGTRRLSISDLKVGDHINVSGLRRANGVIAASYVNKGRPGSTAVIRGRVMSSDPSGFTVNGLRVDAPRANIGRALISGQDVTIVGTAVNGRLRARRVNPAPARPFGGRVRTLSVEGYITRAISGGSAIGQVPITRLPSRTQLRAGDRIILEGPLETGGRFAPSRVRQPEFRPGAPRIQRGYRVPIDPAPRQQVLPPTDRRQVWPPANRIPPPRPPVYRAPPGSGRR